MVALTSVHINTFFVTDVQSTFVRRLFGLGRRKDIFALWRKLGDFHVVMNLNVHSKLCPKTTFYRAQIYAFYNDTSNCSFGFDRKRCLAKNSIINLLTCICIYVSYVLKILYIFFFLQVWNGFPGWYQIMCTSLYLHFRRRNTNILTVYKKDSAESRNPILSKWRT